MYIMKTQLEPNRKTSTPKKLDAVEKTTEKGASATENSTIESEVQKLKDSITNVDFSEHVEEEIVDLQEKIIRMSNALSRKREKITAIRSILRSNQKSDEESRALKLEIKTLKNTESINKLREDVGNIMDVSPTNLVLF